MIVVAATSLLWPKTLHPAAPSNLNPARAVELDEQVFTYSKQKNSVKR
jgi:hypothetical protein